MCVFVVESCVCAGGLLRRSCCVCEGKTEADDGANVYAFAAAGCRLNYFHRLLGREQNCGIVLAQYVFFFFLRGILHVCAVLLGFSGLAC